MDPVTAAAAGKAAGGSGGMGIAAGLQAGASIFNTFMNARMNRKNLKFQDKTNKENRAWEQQMYEWSKNDRREDWHTQNEYNAPAQQMQRLREAGLNPNLVYGKGADNTAASIAGGDVSAQSQKAPQLQLGTFDSLASDASDIFQNVLMYRRIQNQNDLTNSEIKKEEAQRRLIEAQILSELEKIRDKRFNNDLKFEVRDALVKEYKLRNDLNQARIFNIQQNTEQSKTNQQLMSAQIRQINSNILINAQRLAMDKKVNGQRILLMAAQQAESEAKKLQIVAMTATEPNKRAVYDQQVQTMMATAEKLRTEAEYVGYSTDVGAGISFMKELFGMDKATKDRNAANRRNVQNNMSKGRRR